MKIYCPRHSLGVMGGRAVVTKIRAYCKTMSPYLPFGSPARKNAQADWSLGRVQNQILGFVMPRLE